MLLKFVRHCSGHDPVFPVSLVRSWDWWQRSDFQVVSGKETQPSALKWAQLCLTHVSNSYMYIFQVLLGSLWVKTDSIYWGPWESSLTPPSTALHPQFCWLHFQIVFSPTSQLYLVQAIYTCPKAFTLTCILTQFLSSDCFQIVVRMWHGLAPVTQCDENGLPRTRLRCNSLSSDI